MGHIRELDLRPEFRKRMDVPMSWFGTTEPSKLPDYARERMRSRPTATRRGARASWSTARAHIMIWPNLFIAEIQIFVHPAAGGQTRRCST